MPTDPGSSKRLIIPYGVARLTAEIVRRAPSVEIDVAAGVPLRLGDGPYRRGAVEEEAQGSPEDATLGAGAARLDLLRRLHLRDCDVFDKYLRRWIDLYFEFVAAHVDECSAELQALTGTPGAAFDPLLWGMVAPRPLVRAHIPAAVGAHVAVDVALWDGAELIAIVFAGGDKARLTVGLAGRARLVLVDPPGGTTDCGAIGEQLGDVVTGFWRGLAVPPDPFGPAPFRVRNTAAPSF